MSILIYDRIPKYGPRTPAGLFMERRRRREERKQKKTFEFEVNFKEGYFVGLFIDFK